jgi:hypothetical protein
VLVVEWAAEGPFGARLAKYRVLLRGQKLTPLLIGAERVKAGETVSYVELMSASGVGWLIQATVGSFGGVGRWCRNLAGFAA